MGKRTENHNRISVIVQHLDVHCKRDVWLNSLSVIHGKPVSHKLQEMVYFGQSSYWTLRKKSKQNFHVHSMSLSTTKFHKILLSAVSDLRWQTSSVVIFNFGHISKIKMGLNSQKKNLLKFPTNIHIYDNIIKRNNIFHPKKFYISDSPAQIFYGRHINWCITD